MSIHRKQRVLAAASFIVAASFLAAVSGASSDDPNPLAPASVTGSTNPPLTFTSIEEMKRWGESSAFGGGMVSEPYKLGEHAVYVVNRMHTSGVLSAELSVYSTDQDGEGVSLVLFQPARYTGISTKLVDDTLVCESEDPETGKMTTILTISRHLFDLKPLAPR